MQTADFLFIIQMIGAPLPDPVNKDLDLFLNITDRDLPYGDSITFSTNDSLFLVNDAIFTVATTGTVLPRLYHVLATAWDSLGLTCSIALVVDVLDLNDHPPVFTQQSYRGSVSGRCLVPPVRMQKY